MLSCRDCKTFSNKNFINSFRPNLTEENISYDGEGFENLYEICVKTLNQQALRKQILIAGNHGPFINKKVSKAIMKRTRLHNKYLKLLTN